MWMTQRYFLEGLNQGIDLYREAHHNYREAHHNQSLDPPIYNMEWSRPIDRIMVGFCSRGLKRDPVKLILKELEHGEIKQSKDTATVVILSECCGQYNKQQQSLIRDARPDLTLLFPKHHLFGEAFNLTRAHGAISYMLSIHLSQAGIIRLVEPETKTDGPTDA